MHRIRFRSTGSRRNEDGRELTDAIGSAPTREIRQGIASENEEQLSLRTQLLERVDGVGDALTLELGARERETRLARDGGLEHRDAIGGARERVAVFQR